MDFDEIDRRRAVCGRCPEHRTRDGQVQFCARRTRRPDGAYCEPWAVVDLTGRTAGAEPFCERWNVGENNATSAPAENDWFAVRSGRVGHGTLAADGTLGYECDITGDRVLVPSAAGNYRYCLSAHAPSEILLTVKKAVAVRGILNGSALLHAGGACGFWIDHHWIGDALSPCHSTPWIELPPGEYRLKVTTAAARNWGAHSVWLFRDGSLGDAGRLAVVTLGCYPETALKDKLYWLSRSTAKHGLHLRVCGVGTRLGSWFESKIAGMRDWIDALPSCYSHAVYLDGRDSCVLAGETEIVETLNGLPLRTTIGAERCPWPEKGDEWQKAFARADNTPECFPQAGGWGGAIRDAGGLVDTLGQLAAFREAWLKGDCPRWLRDYRHHDDDQFLWQAQYRASKQLFGLDADSRLFVNMTCTNTDLHRFDVFRPQGGRLMCANGNTPCCVHFSGSGFQRMPHWMGFWGID
jgi:hypothetical protein